MPGGSSRNAAALQHHLQHRPLRVAFVHPDLGLGGAERLVVDAAAELSARGHVVDMYTSYYDPNRCFDETRTGAFSVTVAGSWFPRHVFGRLHALCAVVRCALASLYVAWRVYAGAVPPYDVVIVDQVAAAVPVLKLLLQSSRVLFYCHFPDMLLTHRASFVKALYRAPLDALEQAATGAADLILVNSRFTAGVFAVTFERLSARGVAPAVLYPAVVVPPEAELQEAERVWEAELDADLVELLKGGPAFLSINRFERKKGIDLAIRALHELQHQRSGCNARLLIAGGYDERLAENREHLQELREMARDLGLTEHVAFLPSFTDRQRALLLAACRAVLYTPQHEHFGIVPLEAMGASRPVVACNSGGPVESVPDGKGGFLCDPTPSAWAHAMEALLDARAAAKMGAAARHHVQDAFSRSAFGDKLDEHVHALANRRRPPAARR